MATIFPPSPSVDDEYQGYKWDGTTWNLIGNQYNPASYSATAPSNPKPGDLWIESDVDVPSISPETILTTSVAASTYQPLVSGVSNTEIGYLDGVTSAIQTQLNAKQAVVSGVSDTEIGYLDGVTSAIQTQLNAKANLSGATFTGDISTTKLTATSPGGDEGGEINLAKAVTNTTLNTGVAIDVNQNRLRIFEQGGNNRGASLDISTLANGVGSEIAVPGLNGIPYRMAAGSVSIGSNSPVSVTFPSSRFSVSPIVQVTGTSGWGWFSNLSSTGVVIYQTTSWGGASQAGTMHWTAVQMTSGAADG